jgi:hypothetical protein
MWWVEEESSNTHSSSNGETSSMHESAMEEALSWISKRRKESAG